MGVFLYVGLWIYAVLLFDIYSVWSVFKRISLHLPSIKLST